MSSNLFVKCILLSFHEYKLMFINMQIRKGWFQMVNTKGFKWTKDRQRCNLVQVYSNSFSMLSNFSQNFNLENYYFSSHFNDTSVTYAIDTIVNSSNNIKNVPRFLKKTYIYFIDFFGQNCSRFNNSFNSCLNSNCYPKNYLSSSKGYIFWKIFSRF